MYVCVHVQYLDMYPLVTWNSGRWMAIIHQSNLCVCACQYLDMYPFFVDLEFWPLDGYHTSELPMYVCMSFLGMPSPELPICMHACCCLCRDGSGLICRNCFGTCVCVYIYMCVCIYIYTRTYVYVHLYMHADGLVVPWQQWILANMLNCSEKTRSTVICLRISPRRTCWKTSIWLTNTIGNGYSSA